MVWMIIADNLLEIETKHIFLKDTIDLTGHSIDESKELSTGNGYNQKI